eukprot:15140421-Alexandrium_andersonii.AAC.1
MQIPRRPDDDGEAIISGGIRARVPVAAVGIAGLCMCNERLAHVWCGRMARAGGRTARARVRSPK